jgi:hypothetical protein
MGWAQARPQLFWSRRSSVHSKMGGDMQIRKALLEKSLEVLLEKAGDCSDLAKAQRASADKQHESAHKLEKMGQALEDDAAELKNELGMDGGRVEEPVASPAKRRSASK